MTEIWRKQIEELCLAFRIKTKLVSRPTLNTACLSNRTIEIAPILSSISYCSALHEIGHVAMNSFDELEAWQWAKREAWNWTPRMEKCMIDSIESHA